MKSRQFFVIIFMTLSICVSANKVYSQETADVVVMLDGTQKNGKVISIESDTIKFKYSGEDLEYEFKKTDINKIIFASGRTEVFNAPKVTSSTDQNVSNASDRRGKIAVLPFDYITNDPSIMVASMSNRVQMACVNSLREYTTILLKIQDPMTTNAILAKNNLEFKTLRAITPKEMAVMLGVEYVVYGSTDVVNKGTFSSGSEITTYKDKKSKDSKQVYKNSKVIKHGDTRRSGTAVTSGSSSTRISYDTRVDLNIYNDTGSSVYSDSKRAFGSDLESYNSALNYLIKRTPFGTKAKKRH